MAWKLFLFCKVIKSFLSWMIFFQTYRVLVKALSFVIDKSFVSFEKSGFLISKQKWRTIQTKIGSHYIYIRKWWKFFKKLTGTLTYVTIVSIYLVIYTDLTLLIFVSLEFNSCLIQILQVARFWSLIFSKRNK